MARDLDITWDIATGELTFDRTVGNYMKRGETLQLSLSIEADGVASTAIPANTIGTLNPVNDYDPLHSLGTWATFVQVGSTNVFRASATLNADYITTLLGLTTEIWNCIFDLAGTGVNESDTLAVELKNNVTRDDATAPTARLLEYYAGQVNGYADGTWAAAVATTTLAVYSLRKFVDEDGIMRTFALRSSSSATALPGIRRAMDYNASTNPRVWFQVG